MQGKVLRPKQNGTNVKKTTVSDIQFKRANRKTLLMMLWHKNDSIKSRHVWCHQCTAVEQKQMAYLKNQTRSQTFNQPQTQPFSDPVRRWDHIPERGPYTVQYIGPLPYPDQSGVVENYNQNPTDVETLSPRDTVSKMKRQLHFLDQSLNKIQNSLGELQLVWSATPKSTRQN